MNRQEMVQQMMQQARETVTVIEHPDRVAWYRSLIEEWTAQAPCTQVVDTLAVAWVSGYTSQAGVLHPAPLQVWHTSIEGALEALANLLYAQLQEDITALHATAAQWAVASSFFSRS